MTVYELIQELTAKYHPNDTVYICDGGDEVKVESVNDYGDEPILCPWVEPPQGGDCR